jgi:hypothetical protein
MIGLCGAHRTGKTTLALAYANKHNIPFVATGASRVYAELGLDPRIDYPLPMRFAIQEAILEAACKDYKRSGVKFITDRTPIDYMAYLIADVQRENVRGNMIDRLATYVNECFRATNEHFTNLIAVQPGIALIEQSDKAPANLPYMEHINALCLGLLVSERCEVSHYYIPRAVLDLNRRVECIEYAEKVVLGAHRMKVEALKDSGHSFH